MLNIQYDFKSVTRIACQERPQQKYSTDTGNYLDLPGNELDLTGNEVDLGNKHV